MDYYFEIKLKPDFEMRESLLMSLVYNKFHKALVTLRSDRIGVSFPDYKIKLGRIIRFHGCKTDLQNLCSTNWLGGLIGYCAVSKIMPVPANVEYRIISRIRTNMSQSKLKRLKRRGSITPLEEKRYKAKMFSQGLVNPYLDLKSSSTKQIYRRFISFSALMNEPHNDNDKFDSYGLSDTATIPWF